MIANSNLDCPTGCVCVNGMCVSIHEETVYGTACDTVSHSECSSIDSYSTAYTYRPTYDWKEPYFIKTYKPPFYAKYLKKEAVEDLKKPKYGNVLYAGTEEEDKQCTLTKEM